MLIPDKNLQRERRAHARRGNQQLKTLLFASGHEAVQRELILAHVRVNQQVRFGMERTEARERGERNLHLVAHAIHIDEELVGAFLNELAAKRTDHVERLFLSVVRVSMRAPQARKSVRTKKVQPNHEWTIRIDEYC